MRTVGMARTRIDTFNFVSITFLRKVYKIAVSDF